MLTLITGGSKNGKSHIAEDIITKKEGPRFYIATMEPFGAEAQAAVERHRKMRAGKGFETIEKYTDIQELTFEKGSSVLLECMGNLCANEMFGKNERYVADKIIKGVEHIHAQVERLVIVTSQVGDDGIIYPKETMNYIEQMGIINREIAKKADEVIDAVYGMPVLVKASHE